MRSVPADLAKNYSILLVSRGVPSKNDYHFQKWLRYYLDFCHEYQFISNDKDSLPHFLRVQDLNFDTGILTVHDGKGKKDRSVPLPLQILPQLRTQIETVKRVHHQDLQALYDGTFLFDLLDKKYKSAAKELCWQSIKESMSPLDF